MTSSSALSHEAILRTALREHAQTLSQPTDLSGLDALTSAATSKQASAFGPPSSPLTLVTFRAMLQDTSYAPEIFLPYLPGDAEEESDNSEVDYSKLRERSVCWAVGVPGESAWVEGALAGSPESKEDSSRAALHADTKHKFPCIQSQQGGSSRERQGAFLKFYDDATLSPTTVHTVIGLLTHSPAPTPTTSLESDGTAPQEVLHPTIHVLSSYGHAQPLTRPFTGDSAVSVLKGESWSLTREELVKLIADVGLCGEEEWVAEWVLASLCQKNVPPLHPLSLALLAPSTPEASNEAPSDLPLRHLLAHLVPALHPVDLSLPLLNSATFAPRAREREEDLEAGAWQVPKGGVCYVSENGMGEGGKLNEKGIGNLQTLSTLIQHQTLAYQYPFSAFSFVQDLVFIVEGDAKGGTLLPVDAKIPLRPSSSKRKTQEEIAAALPSKEKLDAFRALIHQAKAGTLTVSSEVSEKIQTHFVDHRATHGPASISAEDLGLRMRFCRSLALSEGKEELSWETWERGWAIEEKRASRSDGLKKGKEEKLVGR